MNLSSETLTSLVSDLHGNKSQTLSDWTVLHKAHVVNSYIYSHHTWRPLPVFFFSCFNSSIFQKVWCVSDFNSCESLSVSEEKGHRAAGDRWTSGRRFNTRSSSGPVQVHLPQIPLIHRIASHLSEIWTINQEAVHVSETETQSDWGWSNSVQPWPSLGPVPLFRPDDWTDVDSESDLHCFSHDSVDYSF